MHTVELCTAIFNAIHGNLDTYLISHSQMASALHCIRLHLRDIHPTLYIAYRSVGEVYQTHDMLVSRVSRQVADRSLCLLPTVVTGRQRSAMYDGASPYSALYVSRHSLNMSGSSVSSFIEVLNELDLKEIVSDKTHKSGGLLISMLL